MIKIILIILIINLSLLSKEPPFKYERMNTDYKGIVYNGSNVICYGNYGIMTYSFDRGNKWKQLNIGDKHNILKIKNIDKDFYGITSNSLIKSTDNGLNWEIKEISEIKEINQDNQIIDFSIANDSLIILTNYGVYLSDISLKKAKSIFELDDYTYYNSIENDYKFIYTACDTNLLIRYNKHSKIIDSIDMKKNTKNIPYVDKKTKISNLKIINNELFMYLYLKPDKLEDLNQRILLLKSTNYGESWDAIFKIDHTSCILFENNNYYIMQPSMLSSNSRYNFNIKYLKLDTNKSNSFINLSKDAIGYYHSLKRNDCLESFVRIGSDTLIAVGNSKMIAKSYNNGINWKIDNLVDIVQANMYNQPESLFFRSEKEIYGFNKDETYTSLDGGILWKPRRYSEDYNYFYIYSRYFDVKGNGVLRGIARSETDSNIILTKNYGSDSKKYYNDKLFNNGNRFPINIMNMNSIELGNYHFNVIMHDSIANLSDGLQKYYHFIRYNKDFKVDTISKINLQKIHGIAVNNEIVYILGINTLANYETDSIGSTRNLYKCFIYKSKDYGLTWDSIQIPLELYVYSYSKNYYFGDYLARVNPFIYKDIMFILSRNKILTFDINTNKIDSIRTNNFKSSNKLFSYNDKIFGISDYNSICYIDDINNFYNCDSINVTEFLGDWQSSSNDKILNSFSINDTLAYLSLGKHFKEDFGFGGSYNVNIFKMYKNENRTNVESQTEDQTYFYSYPPYPIPAINEVKSLIYWDMSFDIDASEINVYDVFGNKIDDKSNIKINKLNSYSGYLTWDCSKATSGVYMIQLKHGNKTNNISVMVVR